MKIKVVILILFSLCTRRSVCTEWAGNTFHNVSQQSSGQNTTDCDLEKVKDIIDDFLDEHPAEYVTPAWYEVYIQRMLSMLADIPYALELYAKLRSLWHAKKNATDDESSDWQSDGQSSAEQLSGEQLPVDLREHDGAER